MAHPTLKPGTRVRCTYRNDPGFQHVGTLLADDDPRGWVGSLAFPVGTPTVEQVREHIAHYQQDPRLAAYDKTRATVAWDFGKIYRESAESLFEADLKI
jgi:hypothetical protein